MQSTNGIPSKEDDLPMLDMSVLSKLNSIEICSVSVKDTFYGLHGSCCKQFVTSRAGFSASISKLFGLMQNAVDMHYGTFCMIKEKR